MRDNDFYSGVDVMSLIPPARHTATANQTGVDVRDYDGQLLIILESSAGGGTAPTMDVKIQDSADNSSFADVSGKVFTQVAGSQSRQTMSLEANSVRRYIRAVKTIGGTSPTFDAACVAIGRKAVV